MEKGEGREMGKGGRGREGEIEMEKGEGREGGGGREGRINCSSVTSTFWSRRERDSEPGMNPRTRAKQFTHPSRSFWFSH